MILYHATPRKHLATIEAEGLDPMKSAGKRKEVYLHTASKRAWAVLHTQRRHKTHDIVLIKVNIPRSKLTRRWSGLWSCSAVITEFEAVINADLISQSPIKEG